MIKMSDIFKTKKKLTAFVGVMCILILGTVLLTGGINGENKAEADEVLKAEELYKYKSEYLGNAPNVSELLNTLALGEYKDTISLKTESKPYKLTVNYKIPNTLKSTYVTSVLYDNAVIIFSLIDNADTVTFNILSPDENKTYNYNRTDLRQGYNLNFKEYSKDIKEFKTLLANLSFKFTVFPENYTPAMSSVPGIRINAEYEGSANTVEYSCNKGVLLTWDPAYGKVSKGKRKQEVTYGQSVYWSPVVSNDEINFKAGEQADVITAVINDSKTGKAHVKQLVMVAKQNGFFSVKPSKDIAFKTNDEQVTSKHTDLDKAVTEALKASGKSYFNGEFLTEGHVILDTENKNNKVTVYTISSIRWYGFQNEIFTNVSGSGAIPTVFVFNKDKDGAYTLIEVKEPRDGAMYRDSLKDMFPENLHQRVFDAKKVSPQLIMQQQTQAEEYLNKIGRGDSKISERVERKLPDINTEAQNKLFAYYTKYDEFLNKCPYWLGTREELENSVRYIYKTEQSKTEDGYDLIVFTKMNEDGTIVNKRRYKILGNEPELIEN